MTTFRKTRKRPRQRGQNLVELAVLLPIILTVLLGMAEVALWLQSYLSVATAAREGARYGSRALHIPADEIADVTQVALASWVGVKLTGAGVNTTIIVTEVDLDPDGSYSVAETFTLGELAVASAVCTEGPCAPGLIDVADLRTENVTFNSSAITCTDEEGCRNDVVIVELFYRHRMFLGAGLLGDALPTVMPIDARSVMRVLFRRTGGESS